MNKKKCLNCLCMVDIDLKICSFCKTPFKDGKKSNIPINKFSPPVLGISNKDIEEIKIENKNNEVFEEKNEIDFKIIINSFVNRINKKFPYFIPEFEIESLEIADIKDFENELEKVIENPDSISVDENSLKEINQFASLFVDNEIEEVKEEKKQDLSADRFISKDILRTENKEIEDKKDKDEPVLNIKNLISSLEGIENNNTNTFDISSLELKDERKENFDISSLELKDERKENFDISSLELKDERKENFDISSLELKDERKENFDISSLELKDERKENFDISSLELKEEKKENFDISSLENEKTPLEHYNIAKNLCVKGKYIEALNELEIATSLNPRFEEAHILLSRTYLKLKKDGFIDVKK